MSVDPSGYVEDFVKTGTLTEAAINTINTVQVEIPGSVNAKGVLVTFIGLSCDMPSAVVDTVVQRIGMAQRGYCVWDQ